MPQLGQFPYPALSLDEALTLAGRIAREFGGSISRDGLARTLDMSPRGGHFSKVLGALRTWGVAEGRSEIRVTQLGLRAVAPVSPAEGKESRGKLVQSVELFRELNQRTSGRMPDTPLLQLLLEEITGAPRLTVEQHVAAIAKVYVGAQPSRVPSHTEETPPSGPLTPVSHPPQSQSGSQPRRGGRIEVSYSEGTMSLPETPENLDAVIAVLQSHRKAASLEPSRSEPA